VGMAVAVFTGGALPARGDTGSSSALGEAGCPSPNPPNELTLAAGTPQSATLGTGFATDLQVAVTNSDGCPVTTAVAGIPVLFSAPSAGPGGLFAASGSTAVTVGSDASGLATAPALAANDIVGNYTVTASSAYGSVSFSLTNAMGGASNACEAVSSAVPRPDPGRSGLTGEPTKLTPGVGVTQATPTGARFPIDFAVTVTDAEKAPVPGALVKFAAPNRGPSGSFTVRSGGVQSHAPHTPRSRVTRAHEIEVRADACGVAIAPTFIANHRAGGYIVVASVQHARAAFALVNERR
jgi:hypothetical protein